MKRFLLLFLLIQAFALSSAVAQTAEEFQGVWNWPVPEFEEGSMNFEFINHTLVLEPGKWKDKYTLYDEDRNKYDSGNFSLENGVLTLGKTQYSLEVNEMFPGAVYYELCLMNEGAAPYFTLDKKEYHLISDCNENYESGNYKEILEITAFAEKLGLKSNDLMMEKAKALLELGKDKEARKVLEEILTMDPDHPEARMYIETMDKPRKK